MKDIIKDHCDIAVLSHLFGMDRKLQTPSGWGKIIHVRRWGSDLASQLATKVVELNKEYKARLETSEEPGKS